MNFNLHSFGDGGCRGLWLHGWLGCGGEGEALRRELGGECQLCCPDLPGHGKTPLTGWTLSKTLEQIAELAAGCDWAGGYSMGGRLLMMAAARYPEAFRTLVIESASLGLADAAARAKRKQLDRERAQTLRDLGLEAFCGDWYRMEMWGGIKDIPKREGDAMDLAGALEMFSVANQPDLRQWLCGTPCRVLWLAGERDKVYREQALWVRTHTRHRVEIADAGHNVHAQAPERWGKWVGEFLQMQPGEYGQ